MAKGTIGRVKSARSEQFVVDRLWLDVPYREKDEAKTAGARWDQSARRWYAPRQNVGALSRWAARPPIPEVLPGEDRSLGQGLFVDLVPRQCWFTNVRYCVAENDWERLRRMLRTRAGGICEVCGRAEDRDVKRWLEAHERWSFDDRSSTQKLARLILLCTDCHRTTHFGLAQVHGLDDLALEHLCAVTGMTGTQAQQHVDAAFAVWSQRSARKWNLDLTILTDADIALSKPPSAEQRVAIADEELRQAQQRGSLEARPAQPTWQRDVILTAPTGSSARDREPNSIGRRLWTVLRRR